MDVVTATTLIYFQLKYTIGTKDASNQISLYVNVDFILFVLENNLIFGALKTMLNLISCTQHTKQQRPSKCREKVLLLTTFVSKSGDNKNPT